MPQWALQYAADRKHKLKEAERATNRLRYKLEQLVSDESSTTQAQVCEMLLQHETSKLDKLQSMNLLDMTTGEGK